MPIKINNSVKSESDLLQMLLTQRTTHVMKDRRIIEWERASLIPKYKEKLWIKEH